MAMGQLVLGVGARARECFEVRVGCTKRAEVTGGVGTPVRPSYDTNSYLPHGPRAHTEGRRDLFGPMSTLKVSRSQVEALTSTSTNYKLRLHYY